MPRTKLLHFCGTFGAIIFVLTALITTTPIFLIYALLSGYGAAWVSHFFIEKNKPATFKYPIYSLMGDFKMFFEILIFKHRLF
ncbi:MAG: DUF962 domain-containing protein [Crocinitomicaceae bacterium]|nr:DUF962 domain-containing protein [Crocinitomicaceae bacterium]